MTNNRILSICSLFLLLFPWASLRAQYVTNVESEQVGNQIFVRYTLDRAADITVHCSEDGGATFGPALQKVTGDVGLGISQGNKRLTWDVTAERGHLVGERIVFKVGVKVLYELVFVPGGTFMMGATSEQGSDVANDEKPVHQVTVSDFSIGKYEVTQAQWEQIMGRNPSHFKGDNLPVDNVSWDEIQDFIRKLNAQTGKRYRLPTEAEWEYAARGGNKSRGYKYSGSNDVFSVAWHDDNSSSMPHPVGLKSPNELGLYDMSGNVYEWCQDWSDSYKGFAETDPVGPNGTCHRVLRGGSWDRNAGRSRVSYRGRLTPDSRDYIIGFRLVSY